MERSGLEPVTSDPSVKANHVENKRYQNVGYGFQNSHTFTIFLPFGADFVKSDKRLRLGCVRNKFGSKHLHFQRCQASKP